MSTTTLVPVCRVDEIGEGECAVATVDHLAGRIAVFRVGEEFLALDDRCTHQDAALSDGFVEDCTVECPLHASAFDLRTGEPLSPPARRPVRTYPTVVIDDTVHVSVPARTDG